MPAATTTKKAAAPSKPKYVDMIIAAITTLKSRTGSSSQAILKYINENYGIAPEKARVHARLALKRGVEKGLFTKVKASFKATDAAKATLKPKKKKVVKKKPVKKPKKKVVKKKKPATKKKPKKTAKKTTTKKAKKPAAKKATKAKKAGAAAKKAKKTATSKARK